MLVHLDSSNVVKLGDNFITLLDKYSSENKSSDLLFTLEVINAYFKKTTLENLSQLKDLVVKGVSLVAFDGDQKEQIHKQLSDFLTVD